MKKLLKANVECVIDVRKNPISRKYGFSKNQLQNICNKLGIEYLHIAELGVPSDLRSNLDGEESYYRLLDKYEEEILPLKRRAREMVGKIAKRQNSVLICFEKSEKLCHRGRLANSISESTGLEIKHL
jgi:uncharacterized protein (DUF488 family)